MWLLHVVAMPGNAGWQQGLALWLVVLAIGGGFACLVGEAAKPDALLADLALAAIGGELLNLAVSRLGQDPLALVFGLKLFWTASGAILSLLLTHDAVHLLARAARKPTPRSCVIADRGGFILLFSWLSGWPSEPGIVEATYGRELSIKLMPESLHYQVQIGPLTGAHAIPLLRGITACVQGSTLTIEAEPDTPAAAALHAAVTLPCIRPVGAAELLCETISDPRR